MTPELRSRDSGYTQADLPWTSGTLEDDDRARVLCGLTTVGVVRPFSAALRGRPRPLSYLVIRASDIPVFHIFLRPAFCESVRTATKTDSRTMNLLAPVYNGAS